MSTIEDVVGENERGSASGLFVPTCRVKLGEPNISARRSRHERFFIFLARRMRGRGSEDLSPSRPSARVISQD